MLDDLKVTRKRGGNHHPLSSRQFIIDYLSNDEDYGANIHRAYKAELDRIARENGRRRAYHKPRYHSFEVVIQILAREGQIEFSGREEESDSPQFEGWENKPLRRYYRLK